MKKLLPSIAFFALCAPTAWADNVAHCEALILQVVANDENTGEAQIASYRPAVPFLASLYDEEDGHLTEIDGFPIRAIMCRRNNIIPAESDYPILATGMPFILSQDFDSPQSDSLTMFWKDREIDYVYKGYPLSDERQDILDDRLADFTARGLNTPIEEPKVAPKTEAEIEAEIEAELDALFDPKIDALEAPVVPKDPIVMPPTEIEFSIELDPISESKE